MPRTRTSGKLRDVQSPTSRERPPLTSTPPHPNPRTTRRISASDGDIPQVLNYLQNDPSLLNAGDENGYTPIHAAASYGHRELISILIERGADVHARDTDGDTPLHHCDDKSTAEYLISLGARPDVPNNEGKTAPQVHLLTGEEAMIDLWR